MDQRLVVRPAVREDLGAISELAGQLVRMHHETDPARFFLPQNVESGYAWWFGKELVRPEARILVALRDESLVGYAYGTIEPRDWNLLLDEHGAIHDVFVSEKARKGGGGRALMTRLVSELEGMGAKRIVLSTMVSNESAQRLFQACGFRATMLEMTR